MLVSALLVHDRLAAYSNDMSNIFGDSMAVDFADQSEPTQQAQDSVQSVFEAKVASAHTAETAKTAGNKRAGSVQNTL